MKMKKNKKLFIVKGNIKNHSIEKNCIKHFTNCSNIACDATIHIL